LVCTLFHDGFNQLKLVGLMSALEVSLELGLISVGIGDWLEEWIMCGCQCCIDIDWLLMCELFGLLNQPLHLPLLLLLLRAQILDSLVCGHL